MTGGLDHRFEHRATWFEPDALILTRFVAGYLIKRTQKLFGSMIKA
jgi:hypothetical protein